LKNKKTKDTKFIEGGAGYQAQYPDIWKSSKTKLKEKIKCLNPSRPDSKKVSLKSNHKNLQNYPMIKNPL
jgi:hypothetical protein